jgi:hypothetical protein
VPTGDGGDAMRRRAQTIGRCHRHRDARRIDGSPIFRSA